MSAAVDVRSVLDQAIERERQAGQATVAQIAARAAVAELIEADKEYDASLTTLTDLNRHIAENGWMEVEFDALRNAGQRFVKAKIDRDDALARFGGAA
jgi:predicted signal transduction protein with EAL and GGDEF domain